MIINFKFMQAVFLSFARVALVVWCSLSTAAAQLAISDAPMFVTEVVKPNVFISPIYAAPYNEVSLLDPPWSEYKACVAGTLSGDVCTELTSDAWTKSAMHDQFICDACTTATRLTPWPGAYKADGTQKITGFEYSPNNVLLSDITLYPGDIRIAISSKYPGYMFEALFYYYYPGLEVINIKEEPYPEAVGHGIDISRTSIGKLRYFRSDKNFLYFNKSVADAGGYNKWPAVGNWPATSLPTYDSTVTQAYYNPLKLTQDASNIVADLGGGSNWGLYGPLTAAAWGSTQPPSANSSLRSPEMVEHLIGQYWKHTDGGAVWNKDSYKPTRWGDDDFDNVNFANWFTYWRNSYLATRGMLANLMYELGPNGADVLDKFRMGLHVDNVNGDGSDLLAFELSNTDDILNAVGAAIYDFKTNFTQWTPNRLVSVKLRSGTIETSGFLTTADAYRDEPFVASSPQRACRRNYEIIISPDYTLLRFDKDDAERNRRGGMLRDYAGIDADGDGLKMQFSDAGMVPWKVDLMPSLPNVLLPGKQDEATWQHLVRFIIAPKAKGIIFNDPPYDSTSALNKFSQLTAADWVAAYGTDATRDEFLWSIDDLWHMALNSRGFFYQTNDVRKMTQSILSAFNDVLVRNVSGSSVATNTTSLQQGGLIYQATVESDWKGHLRAYRIDTNGGTKLTLNYSAPVWDLAEKISTQFDDVGWDTGRVIFSYKGATGVPFRWDDLSTEAQDLLVFNKPDNLTTGSDIDAYGERMVNYLRGDGTCEDGSPTASSCSYVDVGPDPEVTPTYTFRRRNLDRSVHTPYSMKDAADLPNTVEYPNGRNLLGDIANSNPWYTTAPVAGLSDVDYPGYNKHRKDNEGRGNVLYVGANDGMLHAVDAGTGTEIFAYVPSFVHYKDAAATGCNVADAYGTLINHGLQCLADASYQHRFYVDGSPFSAETEMMVTSGGKTVTSWRTVLAGSANKGGKGYYLLDVTDVGRLPVTEAVASAKSIVKFEFTHPRDLHYTFNIPVPNANGHARQIARMNDGKWAMIVGNGYPDVPGKKACLFIIYIASPGPVAAEAEADAEGGDYHGTGYHKLCAGVANYSATGTNDGGLNTNGLSTPTPVDLTGDGKVDVVYAGDLNGNMWRFNVSSTTPTEWAVEYSGVPLFVAKNDATKRQPIITPPEVTPHTSGSVSGHLVLFGTGKFLGSSDRENVDVQSFYGVWARDALKQPPGTPDPVFANLRRSHLIEQVFDAPVTAGSITYRNQTTSLVPLYCVDKTLDTCDTSHMGWYWDMDIVGERLTGRVNLISGTVFFNTFYPITEPYLEGGVTKYRLDPCQYGGDGWLMCLNHANGYLEECQDTGLTEIIDSKRVPVMAGGMKVGAALGGTTFARGLEGKKIGIYSPTNVGTGPGEEDKMLKPVETEVAKTGRVSWYELLD